MEKKGFIGLIVRTAFFLVILSALLFYVISIKNSSQATTSARATLEKLSEKFEDLAKKPINNQSNKSAFANNYTGDFIRIGEENSSSANTSSSNLSKEIIRIKK